MPCGVKPDSGSLRPMKDALRQRGAFADLVDYRLAGWREGAAEISLEVGPQHLNRSGVLHGGVIATLIDTACGFAGCYRPPPQKRRRALTLSLHTQFLGPVAVGAQLRAEARRIGGGRQIFFSSCEVRDQDGRLVARGDGTFRYRSQT